MNTTMSRLLTETNPNFNVIDIGCRGHLDEKWKPLEPIIHLHGFDLDQAECDRLSQIKGAFKSVRYHPHAIAGDTRPATLFITRNEYCCSLLRPDTAWLRRFDFREMLEVVGERAIRTVGLRDIAEFRGLDLDIFKCDSQGLELEILRGAGDLMERAIYVETESGFTPNYHGESTQAEVDMHMRSQGFLLFDLKLSRMAHSNQLKHAAGNRTMLLWSESVWLRDYLMLAQKNQLIPGANITREKGVKILAICAIQGCVDYGFEVAKILRGLDLLADAEFDGLKNAEDWRLAEPQVERTAFAPLNLALRLLPGSLRRGLSREAAIAADQRHIFRRERRGSS